MELVTLSLPEAYDRRWRYSAPMDLAPTTRRPLHVMWPPGSATAALPTACGGCWALSIPCVKVRYRLMPSRKSTIRRRRLRGRTPAALSLLAYERALPLLLEKARHSGIAALAINRCVHFSALFADIEPLTEAGLVGLACTPSHAWVAPAGGTRPLFGTNPIAFGWPRRDKPPFIVDMATSAARRDPAASARRQSAT